MDERDERDQVVLHSEPEAVQIGDDEPATPDADGTTPLGRTEGDDQPEA